MPSTELDKLVAIGVLDSEPSTKLEFERLLESGARRLVDAANPSLSLYSRFDLGYNAAHALALAALRFHGYRPKNRYVVFQCLIHTLGLLPAKWRVLDQAHNKRNRAEYEGDFDVDTALVESLIRVAAEVEALVRALA